VVATDGQQPGPGPGQTAGRRLDLGDGLPDVERVDGDVAGIDDLLPNGCTSRAGL